MSSRKPPGPACPPDHKHGQTGTCYCNHKCRCTQCRAHVAAVAARRYRLKAYGRPTSHTIPATGARRRIQALIAIGWTHAQLSRALGLGDGSTWRLTTARNEQITIDRHNTIAALFDKLWDQTPPQDPRRGNYHIQQSITHARARGWLPPLAWDDIDTDPEPPVVDEEVAVDEMAVELAINGQQVHLTRAERIEAIRILNARKLSDTAISERLGIHKDSIQRYRRQTGIPAVFGPDQLPIAS